MELTPWRPFGKELSSLRREMDRMWDRFMGETPFPRIFRGEWAPSVDISEDKNSVVVKAELPGMEAKDVEVNLTDNVLTIKGEKKEEKEQKDERRHVIERYHGSFERSFQLPGKVQSDKIDAVFEKGVLKITLPKTEEAKKKEIKIKVK
jgi:HSP20 family protein